MRRVRRIYAHFDPQTPRIRDREAEMHLTEANMISCRSEYFLYSATPKMRNCMYYPHRVGLGDFMPGYSCLLYTSDAADD